MQKIQVKVLRHYRFLLDFSTIQIIFQFRNRLQRKQFNIREAFEGKFEDFVDPRLPQFHYKGIKLTLVVIKPPVIIC